MLRFRILFRAPLNSETPVEKISDYVNSMCGCSVDSSRNNIVRYVPPKVWGADLWIVLHSAADLGNRHDDILTYWTLWDKIFELLGSSLPCAECSAHCKIFLEGKFVLNQTPSEIIGELHNDVNRRLGHPPTSSHEGGYGELRPSLLRLRGILIEEFWNLLRKASDAI
jgi:hypothetical protein